MRALGLNGSGRLDLVVLEVAVVAGERHDDDLAEVGDLGKEEPCHALKSGLAYDHGISGGFVAYSD